MRRVVWQLTTLSMNRPGPITVSLSDRLGNFQDCNVMPAKPIRGSYKKHKFADKWYLDEPLTENASDPRILMQCIKCREPSKS